MSEIPPAPSPKKEVIAPRQESAAEEIADDPPGAERNYGEARLWLIARDPHCLFAYWEFRPEEHPGAIGEGGRTRFFLRIFPENGAPVSSIEIASGRGHAFIPAPSADTDYFAELGFPSGEIWCFLARSGVTRTPPALPGAEAAPSFATIPAQLSLAELREATAASALPGESPAATAARIQAAARTQAAWSPEQERLLAKIFAASDTATEGTPPNSRSIPRTLRQKLAATASAAEPGMPIDAPQIERAPETPGASWPTSR